MTRIAYLGSQQDGLSVSCTKVLGGDSISLMHLIAGLPPDLPRAVTIRGFTRGLHTWTVHLPGYGGSTYLWLLRRTTEGYSAAAATSVEGIPAAGWLFASFVRGGCKGWLHLS